MNFMEYYAISQTLRPRISYGDLQEIYSLIGTTCRRFMTGAASRTDLINTINMIVESWNLCPERYFLTETPTEMYDTLLPHLGDRGYQWLQAELKRLHDRTDFCNRFLASDGTCFDYVLTGCTALANGRMVLSVSPIYIPPGIETTPAEAHVRNSLLVWGSDTAVREWIAYGAQLPFATDNERRILGL